VYSAPRREDVDLCLQSVLIHSHHMSSQLGSSWQQNDKALHTCSSQGLEHRGSAMERRDGLQSIARGGREEASGVTETVGRLRQQWGK
jgi:hypothetical protein